MIKKYEYRGEVFMAEYEVRRAILKAENKALPKVILPEGWDRFGVVYSEEDDPEPIPRTPEEIAEETQQRLTDAVQKVLDDEAQKLNYDNCLSVCSYVDTGVTKFDDEGRAFRAWRSAVWAKGYEILAQCQAGGREIPTEEELIAELPKLTVAYTE